MAIICPSYKLLFIMCPRTACSAVGKVLREQLDGQFLPSESINGLDKVHDKKHNTLQQLFDDKILTHQEASSYLKFTCVRNPFDSLPSLYEKKRGKYQALLCDKKSWIYQRPSAFVEDIQFCLEHSFDEWILKNYNPSFIKRMFSRGHRSLFNAYTSGVDMVMRFEDIHNDFRDVLTKAGISQDIPLPYFNQTFKKHNNYRNYYSPRSRKLVEYVFENDLKLYGYKF